MALLASLSAKKSTVRRSAEGWLWKKFFSSAACRAPCSSAGLFSLGAATGVIFL